MSSSVNSASNKGGGQNAAAHSSVPSERPGYLMGQALVTVTNNPRAESQAWWGFRMQDNSWKDPPPPLDPVRYPPITRQTRELDQYLRLLAGDRLQQFYQDRASLEAGMQLTLALEGQGEH